MATITDIARETGMARTSVAQILQGRPGYNPQTRQRVRETARRLGYRPNYLSKALRGGKSMSIGMIWPMRGVTGDVDVGMGILERMRERGYATYQDETKTDDASLSAAVDDLASRRADALVLWLYDGWSGRLPESLNAFPAVLLVWLADIPGFKQDVVIHDRHRAIDQVVDHFAATGRRHPAIVLSNLDSQRHKINRFLERCRCMGMTTDERSIVSFPGTVPEPELVRLYQSVYARHFRDGVDVDALFCGTDQGAMAAIHFFQGRGIRVPEDVAVVGWNNLSIGPIWTPPLATIDRRRDELAQAVQELLLSRLETPDQPPRRRTIHMEFTYRESAGGASAVGMDDTHTLHP